ncbi:hypothetical protein [Virgibacillus doumboii]|uniref:hypothetical protein n=1 Tax=Virgibacillus doumboii TaxID=2697503 RepID=UPI0013DEB022|nr:hypothetical protein [Virgibacillus doumboii]
MVIAFQIVLLIIIFSAAVMAITEKQDKDIRITSFAVNLAAIIAFIVSVMWL